MADDLWYPELEDFEFRFLGQRALDVDGQEEEVLVSAHLSRSTVFLFAGREHVIGDIDVMGLPARNDLLRKLALWLIAAADEIEERIGKCSHAATQTGVR